MNYVLIAKQKGIGCDCTIGCGISYHEFEAEDDVDAVAKAKERWDAYTANEYELEYMMVCEVAYKCPINEWEAENKVETNL